MSSIFVQTQESCDYSVFLPESQSMETQLQRIIQYVMDNKKYTTYSKNNRHQNNRALNKLIFSKMPGMQ